ncbi:MAG: glycosyltransferase [Desulfobacterales bacterium]|nr:glycosyltransferase [Desulfobacterales bacterium]
MSRIDCSFVLLTWNSESYLENCLHSIFTALNSTNIKYEIFIVDNGSQDNTVNILKRLKGEYPSIINPIFLQYNTGTTYSRNLALKQISGRYICIMDSDVDIFPGVLEKLIHHLENRSDVGLCVPRIIYPSGKLQKSTDVFPNLMRKVQRYFFLKNIESKEAAEKNAQHITEVDYAISAMWVFKRSLIDQIGLLDEKIFYAPEDADYCLRIWKAGYKILYDSHVTIVHHTQEISRGFKFNKAFFYHIKGLIYYFIKHHYLIVSPDFKKVLKKDKP